MISLSLSAQLFSDLRIIFGSDLKEGELVSKALRLGFDKELALTNISNVYKDSGKYRPFYISKSVEIRLKRLLKERLLIDPNATITSIAFALLCAVANKNSVKSKSERVESCEYAEYHSWLDAVNLSKRPEQQKMISSIMRAMTSTPNGIIMNEASVGVGKSHAKAIIAIARAKELKDKGEVGRGVVIAAPTYQIAKQILKATLSIIDAKGFALSAILTRSRAEYVSEKFVLSYLDSDESESIGTQVKQEIEALLKQNIYLRERYEAAGLDCSKLTLSSKHSDPDDKAELKYQEERSSYLEDNIIVCTHAFLACHVMSIRRHAAKHFDNSVPVPFLEFNKSCYEEIVAHPELFSKNRILPQTDLLIIDEAHTLYDSYQSLKEKRLSLNALKNAISKALPKTPSNMTKFIDDFISEVSLSCDHNGLYPAKKTSQLKSGCTPLLAQLKKKKDTPEKRALLDLIDEITDLTFPQAQSRTHEVYMSPVKGFCSIKSTSYPPSDWLNMTWLLANQAVCVSGTLALGSGVNIYQAIAGKLCIDFKRLNSVPAIETSWLRKSVELHRPDVSNSEKDIEAFKGTAFLPIQNGDYKNLAKRQIGEWVRAQANYVAKHLRAVDGGAIIVCTSYDQISMLFDELVDLANDIPNIKVMKSTQGSSLVSQVAQYKKIYHSGKKPVWVAIVSVGTGVDITDSVVDASKDRMLTQLFITRLPISAKKENHMQKINNALLLYKQLIGRLVRRPGRSNMHLHIMDARANLKTGIYKRFKSVGDKYEKNELGL